MTTDSFEIAIRAEESAKAAHYRLDRMNGSIDRLGDRVGEMNGKIDAFIVAAAERTGFQQGTRDARTSLLESRRFTLSLIVALFAALMTLLLVFFH